MNKLRIGINHACQHSKPWVGVRAGLVTVIGGWGCQQLNTFKPEVSEIRNHSKNHMIQRMITVAGLQVNHHNRNLQYSKPDKYHNGPAIVNIPVGFKMSVPGVSAMKSVPNLPVVLSQ